MWEADCGVVPVIDAESRVVGMITDRDVCMAAYTQGKPLWQIPVSSACSQKVYACKLNDSLQTAENLMRVAQVRRLPVVDEDGQLWGLVSLGDLAQHVHRGGGSPDGLSYASIALTLAAISQFPAEISSDANAKPNGTQSQLVAATA
jgi:CBS-domain-containing membrane protein